MYLDALIPNASPSSCHLSPSSSFPTFLHCLCFYLAISASLSLSLCLYLAISLSLSLSLSVSLSLSLFRFLSLSVSFPVSLCLLSLLYSSVTFISYLLFFCSISDHADYEEDLSEAMITVTCQASTTGWLSGELDLFLNQFLQDHLTELKQVIQS